MPAYVIAQINVRDTGKYQEYAQHAAPAVAKYGGRYLARGGAKHTLEGDIPFARLVLLEFPDTAAAKRFYDSPEYRDARKHRAGAADFNMVIVEGA